MYFFELKFLYNCYVGSSQTTPISSTSLSDSSTHDSVLCSGIISLTDTHNIHNNYVFMTNIATINAVSTPTLSDHDTASSSSKTFK